MCLGSPGDAGTPAEVSQDNTAGQRDKEDELRHPTWKGTPWVRAASTSTVTRGASCPQMEIYGVEISVNGRHHEQGTAWRISVRRNLLVDMWKKSRYITQEHDFGVNHSPT